MEFLNYASQIVGLIAGITSLCPAKQKTQILAFWANTRPSVSRAVVWVILTSILLVMPAPDAFTVTFSLTVEEESAGWSAAASRTDRPRGFIPA